VVPAAAVAAEVAARRNAGAHVGAVEASPGRLATPPCEVLPATPDAYAAELYAALHRLDDAGVDVIVVGAPPDEPGWEALRDRLRRAAS
jgi:L-threonylcarbamoyladenylate synthase